MARSTASHRIGGTEVTAIKPLPPCPVGRRVDGSRGNWEHVQAVDEQLKKQKREEAIQEEQETR